jgi:hypothetical protein
LLILEWAVGQHLDAVLRAVFLGRFDPRLRQIAIPCRADVDFNVLRHLPLVLACEQLGHPERQKLLVLLPVRDCDLGADGRFRSLIRGLLEKLVEFAPIR